MNRIDENQIRKLAHQIWESEGHPHGSEERHWEMAKTLVEAETRAGELPADSTMATPAPRATARTRRVVDKPVPVANPRKPGAKKQ